MPFVNISESGIYFVKDKYFLFIADYQVVSYINLLNMAINSLVSDVSLDSMRSTNLLRRESKGGRFIPRTRHIVLGDKPAIISVTKVRP